MKTCKIDLIELLMNAMGKVLKEGKATTPDIGGKGMTTSMTDAVIAAR